MILGIDFGATTTDAVLLSKKRIVKKASAEKISSISKLNSFLKKNNFDSSKISRVVITGGKSASLKGKILGINPVHVSEIDAIGLGASFLSNAKKCLAVSFGTGTCIVSFENGKTKHVIGSGVGGGTITGLSKLLVKENNIEKLTVLASKGNFGNVDLSVKHVVGGKIGLLNADATASNFARGRGSKADLAAAVQNMVAESVAVLAIAASRQCKCNRIIFLGKGLAFPLAKKRLKAAAKVFGAKFEFPSNADVGVAAGAACF